MLYRVPRCVCEAEHSAARSDVLCSQGGEYKVGWEGVGTDGNGAAKRALVTRLCRHPNSPHAVAVGAGLALRIPGTEGADGELC